MADPYAPRHIIYANVVAGTSSQPQIDKMTEQIRLLSKEVIGLRGKIPTHSQPAHDVPTHLTTSATKDPYRPETPQLCKGV